MTVRLVSASDIARTLKKSRTTIARWCAAGDVHGAYAQHGEGTGRRWVIPVTDNTVTICGIQVTVE